MQPADRFKLGGKLLAVGASVALLVKLYFFVSSLFLLSNPNYPFSLANRIIGFLAGALSKKVGHSRALIFGASLAIIALIITGTTNNLILIFIGNFFIGTAEVIILASSYVIASDLIPYKVRARLFGAYNATFFLSWGLAGTIISGPIIDFLLNTGVNDVSSYRVAFMVGALITGIGLVIFVILEIWLKPRNTKTYKN